MSDSIAQLMVFERLRQEMPRVVAPEGSYIEMLATYVPVIAPGSQN